MSYIKLFPKYRKNYVIIVWTLVGLVAAIALYILHSGNITTYNENESMNRRLIANLKYLAVSSIVSFALLVFNTFSFVKIVNKIKEIDTKIEFAPNNYERIYEKGILLSKINSYEEAIAEFNKCIELNHDFADAYKGRGDAYNELDDRMDFQNALKDWQKAEELKKNGH